MFVFMVTDFQLLRIQLHIPDDELAVGAGGREAVDTLLVTGVDADPGDGVLVGVFQGGRSILRRLPAEVQVTEMLHCAKLGGGLLLVLFHLLGKGNLTIFISKEHWAAVVPSNNEA